MEKTRLEDVALNGRFMDLFVVTSNQTHVLGVHRTDSILLPDSSFCRKAIVQENRIVKQRPFFVQVCQLHEITGKTQS